MSEKTRKSWLWPALAWCLGILGMIGIWLSISVWLDSACLWMTVFATLDLILMLRLTGVRAGWSRFLGIVAGTSIIVIASQWLIAANAFGLVMGLWPLEAAQQIGPVLAGEFTRLRVLSMDLIYLPFSIILAWFLGMRVVQNNLIVGGPLGPNNMKHIGPKGPPTNSQCQQSMPTINGFQFRN